MGASPPRLMSMAQRPLQWNTWTRLFPRAAGIHHPRGARFFRFGTRLLPHRASLALTLVLHCITAQAQAPAAEASQYRQVIEEAVAEFQRANWAEAIVLFRRAHKLQPSAKTHRGLGQAYFEARDYVNAIPHLRAALALPHSFTSEQQAHVTRLLERSLSFVGTVELDMRPEHATLTVDGMALEVTNRTLLLNPGAHTVIASAEGYKPLLQEISVEGGTKRSLRLTLVAQPNLTVQVEEAPAPAPEESGQQSASPQTLPAHNSSSSTVLLTLAWVSAGLSLSGAIATTALWYARESGPVQEWDEFGCKTVDSERCDEIYGDARDLKRATVIVGASSGAVAATALALFIAAELMDDGDDSDSQALTCSGSGDLGLRCGFTF